MVSEKLFFIDLVSANLQVKKNFEEPRMKLSKKVNKPVLSHITFYLEDDDHKPVGFNNVTT